MSSVEFGFLEDVGTDIMSVVGKLQPYLNIVKNVAEDPALPEVMKRVQQMRDTAAKQAAVAQKKVVDTAKAAGKPAPAAPVVGIGLKKFVKPLDAVVWVQAHPTATVLIGVGGLVAIAGIGFLIGRKVGRKKAGLGGLGWPPPDPKKCRKIAEQIDAVAKSRHRAQMRDSGGETLSDYKRRLDALTASYSRADC